LGPYYAGDIGDVFHHPGSGFYHFLKGLQLAGERRRLAPLLKPGRTVVDFGSGSGDFSLLLRRQGCRVLAVDAGSCPPLLEAHKIPYGRVDFDTYRFEAPIAVEDGVAYVRLVFEHVRDPQRFLRALVAQGIRHVYLSVPDAGCPQAKWLGPHWFLWDPPRHLWHFTRHSLDRVVNGAGFDIVRRGWGISPDLIPSLYRYCRRSRKPEWLCRLVSPKGSLCAVAGTANQLFLRNVVWVMASLK
jgi:hypothetical protein